MRHLKIHEWFMPISYLFLSFLVLFIPLLRFIKGNPLFVAGDHYYYLFNLIGLNISNVPINFLIFLMNLVIVILSLTMFSEIAKKYCKDEFEYYISIILFITLPTFIIANIGFNILALLFLLILTLFYSFNEKPILFWSSLVLLTLLSPITSFALFIYVLLYDKSKHFIKYFSIIFILIFIASMWLQINYVFFQLPKLNLVFTFFGAMYGYSVILILFGLIGAYHMYSAKRNVLVVWYSITLFILSFFIRDLRVLLIIILTFISAKAIKKIIKVKWENDFLNFLTILLLVCIVFFTLSTSIQTTLTHSPTSEQVDALMYLKQEVKYSNITLLTSPKYSSFIKYYSGIEPFIKYNNIDSNLEIAEKMFYSRRYDNILEYIKAYNIKYFIIDTKMIEGDIWPNDRDDLMFILNNNKNFKRIYSQEGVKIYEFRELEK